MASAEPLHVEVVYCPGPGVVDLVPLSVPDGSTLADALRVSGLAARHGLDASALKFGVWGRVQQGAVVLRDRDRIEVYRPLTVDPKEARRQRYKRHRQGVG